MGADKFFRLCVGLISGVPPIQPNISHKIIIKISFFNSYLAALHFDWIGSPALAMEYGNPEAIHTFRFRLFCYLEIFIGL